MAGLSTPHFYRKYLTYLLAIHSIRYPTHQSTAACSSEREGEYGPGQIFYPHPFAVIPPIKISSFYRSFTFRTSHSEDLLLEYAFGRPLVVLQEALLLKFSCLRISNNYHLRVSFLFLVYHI